ncbi:hypothetical protein, partial [Streptomyces sp. NPDC001966]
MSTDGTLLGGKNIESVTKGRSVGNYCVKVTSRAVSDLSTAAIVATLNDFGKFGARGIKGSDAVAR